MILTKSPFVILLFLGSSLLASDTLLSGLCRTELEHFPDYHCLLSSAVFLDDGIAVYALRRGHKRYLMISKPKNKITVGEIHTLELVRGVSFVSNIIEHKFLDDRVVAIFENFGATTLSKFDPDNEYFSSLHNFFSFFRKLLKGLADIHKRGVVHADLKPSNILVDDEGNPTIFNFESAVKAGKSALPRGTYNYVSPEIFRHFEDGSYAAFRAENDLYSLGVVMYETYMGRLPFRIFDAKYSEMMSRGIYFSSSDNWEVFRIISGLLRPLSSRLSIDRVRHLVDLGWFKVNPKPLGTNIKYKLADFANQQELEADMNDVLPYLWAVLALLVLTSVGMICGFYWVRRRKRLADDQMDRRTRSFSISNSQISSDSLESNVYGDKIFAIKAT